MLLCFSKQNKTNAVNILTTTLWVLLKVRNVGHGGFSKLLRVP